MSCLFQAVRQRPSGSRQPVSKHAESALYLPRRCVGRKPVTEVVSVIPSSDALFDKSRLGLQHRTHDFLPKFADIARPHEWVSNASVLRNCQKPLTHALQFLIGNLTEELRQRHDVLLTVTQRRERLFRSRAGGTANPAGNVFSLTAFSRFSLVAAMMRTLKLSVIRLSPRDGTAVPVWHGVTSAGFLVRITTSSKTMCRLPPRGNILSLCFQHQ